LSWRYPHMPPTALVPGLEAPTEFRAIVNAHFRIDPPAGLPPILGVINATTEWIFAFSGAGSRSPSAPATRLIDTPREEAMARTIWDEVQAATGLSARAAAVADSAGAGAPPSPPRRRRINGGPGPATRWRNLVLAGDWTDTGPPRHHRGRHPVRQTAAADFGGRRLS